jgi:uncharacterized membrane protein
MFLGMGLIGLLFGVALIGGLVWLLGGFFPTQRQAGTTTRASENTGEILEQRYARGEISREEFLLIKADLEA